jgi:hypothetical protein
MKDMKELLLTSPFLVLLLLGLALGVVAMLRGIDRHLQRRGRVGPFNMPTVAAFATVAGAVGYLLVRYTTLHTLVVSGIALASGLAGAVGMFTLLAGVVVPSAAKDVEDPRFVLQGHFAQVTAGIGAGTRGEIAYEHDGGRQSTSAEALDGQPIEVGAEVVIERIEDGVAYVERWSRIARDLELPA